MARTPEDYEALERRVSALEKLLAATFACKQEDGEGRLTTTSVKHSRRLVALGAGTYLWEWFQTIDDEIASYLGGLSELSQFKHDTMCMSLVKADLLLDVAAKISQAPTLADHWDLINIYPLSLGRFVPMVPAAQSTNGLRVIYERVYHHLYNRARIILPKIAQAAEEIIDLTSDSEEVKASEPPQSKPATVVVKRETLEFLPPLKVEKETGPKAKAPVLPTRVPVGSQEKVSGPRSAPRQEPESPKRKAKKKRAPVSPVHQPESPVKKSEPKKARHSGSEGKTARRVLFREDDDGFEEEASEEEELTLPTKRERKPSKALLESIQQASPEKEEEEEDEDDNASSSNVDMQNWFNQFLAFSPSPVHLKAKDYQFGAKELTKALKPLRKEGSPPADIFVALATTYSERQRLAPSIAIKNRGSTDSRKRLTVFSFQHYPGLVILKGNTDPTLLFKLYFDAAIVLNVNRNLVELETVFWKKFLVANALLWTTVAPTQRLLDCLKAQKVEVPEVVPGQRELIALLTSLPFRVWDSLIDEFTLDFIGTDNLESGTCSPKTANEAGKLLLHPYMLTAARNVKTGIVRVVNNIAPTSSTDKQATLRASLLLWALFPQPTEIPSILAHWISLFLGVGVKDLRIMPTVRSPLWDMFWDVVA